MKSIVITGSTSGTGFGLADSFLSLGCSVTINGSQTNLEKAYRLLATKHEHSRLLGSSCDVTYYDQLQTLRDAAKAHP